MTPLSVSDRVSIWAGNREQGAHHFRMHQLPESGPHCQFSGPFWDPKIHTNLSCGSQVRGTFGGTGFVRVFDELLFAILDTNVWYRGAFSFVKTVVFVTYTFSFEFANSRQKMSQNDHFERQRSRQRLAW